MNHTALNELENKLDQLISLCQRLKTENQNLRAKESEWARERTRLVEKNELARTRVEAIISKLKDLETHS